MMEKLVGYRVYFDGAPWGEPWERGRVFRTAIPAWRIYQRQVTWHPQLRELFEVRELGADGTERKLEVPDLAVLLKPPAGTYYQVFLDDVPYRDGQHFRKVDAAWKLYNRVLDNHCTYVDRLNVREISPSGVRILK